MILRKLCDRKYSLFKSYSISVLSQNINPVKTHVKNKSTLPSNLQEDGQIKIGGFSINYTKVGTGPCTVFCFPGILGNTFQKDECICLFIYGL